VTTRPECAYVERTHAFADGELTGGTADEARDHLATCATCQAELAELLQLDAMVADRTAQVISLAWYRRRRVQLAAATLAVAAAASVAIYVALPQRARPVAPDAVAVVLAPRRVVEARLAWHGAAAYRAYDVPRAGEPPHETIDLMSIARLDQQGDAHGVGVLELLNGERRQAAGHLERAGDSADVLSDRAALALGDNQPERALALADAALETAAGHGPALWNRALALRDLGLSRAASVAFRAVVKRGEPGWSVEAEQRAASLDAETDALQHRFERINQASVALAGGKLELSAGDAGSMPGFARGILYDAIRSASTLDQLAALAPLGYAIDVADHDTAMADALGRARTALHPALSRQYGEMIRSLAVEMQITPRVGDEAPVPAGAARAQLLAALRAAHADDLLIGVLMKISGDRRVVDRGEIAEFARLTAASPDPWMQILGLQQQAEVALNQDDMVGAEAILLRAKQRCAEPGAPGFRCILINRLLGKLYLEWQRLPEAHAVLSAAWQAARASGEWVVQDALLDQRIELASLGDETEATGLPLVRAFTAEYVLRFPEAIPAGRCDRASWGRDREAMLLIDQLQFEAARQVLDRPSCSTPQEPARAAAHLFVRAEVASQNGTAAEIAELRNEIAALRASPSIRPAEQVELAHSEGRLLIDRDPSAGEASLRWAIEAAKAIPPAVTLARKAAAWSYSVLVIAAARRGDGDRALALLAEEQGLALPRQCVLGLGVEDQRRAIMARDASGKTIVHADADRKTPRIDASRLVPAEISAAFIGCPVVDVIARAPLHGMSRLLPDAIAWRYLSRRVRPATATTDRLLVVADVEPPSALELPHLATWSATADRLSGPAATPSRVLAAIGAAGEVVVHAHGIVDVAQPDASFLALSPDPAGRFALTTGDVRKARFATSPLVILAACRSARAAPVWHETWSLPAAFIYAGARAVIASAAPIPDGDAAEFFDSIRAGVRGGAPVAIALRDARQQWIQRGRGDWVRDVIVFE
jgi:hypothetical protein